MGLTMYDLYDYIMVESFVPRSDSHHEFPLSIYESREANSFTVHRLVSVYPFTGTFAELKSGVREYESCQNSVLRLVTCSEALQPSVFFFLISVKFKRQLSCRRLYFVIPVWDV